ncbi:TetR/AcrR family transcriptional regulator [Microbacterium esteraromaticum]|uniref:TetR/AcrR family transcriptional regulator n=1 Tax=Microbacterium esteraromaticum TaxID=57043 RepID=A0A7D8AID4_9MICO|nr:TetR/AcrR family transcriptional regulator [Microbacterium esteraromaticum]QMU98343.1 TetR/AcrR family transcriptional regulator [Microbacterium esteraromaticum]
MPDLIDLLWRDDSAAGPARRGPRRRTTPGEVISSAIALADDGGLPAVTVRALAQRLGLTPMAVYTYVNSREDLLVLMADLAYMRMPAPVSGGDASPWRDRVRCLAHDNRDLLCAQPWLLEVHDPRVVLGPGTIAKYDRELAVFDGLGLDDVQRDAALSFVLDFAMAGALRRLEAQSAEGLDWDAVATPLAGHLGDRHPLAQQVGATAGAEFDGAYDPDAAWRFGLERVLDGLAPILEQGGPSR